LAIERFGVGADYLIVRDGSIREKGGAQAGGEWSTEAVWWYYWPEAGFQKGKSGRKNTGFLYELRSLQKGCCTNWRLTYDQQRKLDI
jgi:hypothetical protein